MSLATIHRLVISSCRDKIAIDARWRIVSSLSILQKKKTAVIQTDTCMNHNRFFHNSIIHSQKNQLKESGTAIENVSALQIKNRPSRRNRTIINNDKIPKPNTWNVKALATAEEYNLEALAYGLLNQQLYIPSKISTSANSFVPDVIHATAKYEIEQEPREIFFFREGSIVMWNISDLESGNLLQFLKRYEQNRYMEEMVHTETELMNYTHADSGKSHLKDGDIILAEGAGNLDKYTFSNAMVQSVKLGIWEAALNRYVDSIEFVTEDLKTGRKLQMTQQEVLRKQGELFALRHRINLSSDLLDTPDFYWDRDDLENLYQQICGYFSIAKRTRVMNERLNHCLELGLDSVIQRAKDAGVQKIMVIGGNIRSSKEALRLTRIYPGTLYSTAGVHPHDAKSWEDPDTLQELESIAKNPECVAIGECGLDYSRDFSAPEAQRAVFHKQIELACILNKPLVIHERGAQKDVLEVLGQYKNRLPAVLIHSFIGTAEEAQTYLDQGFYLGITGYLCKDKSDSSVRQLLEAGQAPLDKILIETDAPFMYPNTRASKLPAHVKDALTERSMTFLQRYCTFQRNEPCALPAIVEMVAAFMRTTPEEVALATAFNALKLFGLNQ